VLKENWRSISRLERFSDAILIVGAFFVAYWLREILPDVADVFGLSGAFSGRMIAPLKDYVILLVVSLFSYLVSLESQRAYGSMRLRSPGWLFRIALVSSFIAFVAMGTAAFLLKIDASRTFIVLHCTVAGIGLQLERFCIVQFLRYWRRRGRNFRNLVVCGRGIQASRLIRDIARRPELGIRLVGIACFDEPFPRAEIEGEAFRLRMVDRGFVASPCKLLIGIDRLTTFLSEAAVDEVLFTDVVSVMRDVEEMVTRCSEQGVRTSIVADLFNMGMFRSELSYFGSVPLVHYQTPPGDGFDLAVKRVFDIVSSAGLLIILAPLFAIIAVAVRSDSAGPILFKQRRVGLNGRIFSLYKFRSMQVDAESQLSALRQENEMQGPAFKLRNDPRVTSVGRLIRRHSLDELPQLWNVLRGDMSLVGPRPPVPDEVQLYDRKERRRLSMRPGLTCTWQVSGRNDIADFESWVQLDLEYIDNWSLGLDFSLLVRTVPAVVFGSGAR
jgi:exopolysaccharide biosynthesis polyprenyl glycosylphosphotransferase